MMGHEQLNSSSPSFAKQRRVREIFGSIGRLSYDLLEMNSVVGIFGNWNSFGGWDLVLGIWQVAE
jgi:hypothetical protein